MILIKTVRIHGFRGLQNLEIDLEQTTVLTGMNNTGKTSFLKALQLVLGSRQFISPDDFYTENNQTVDKIIIDLKIVPVDENGEILEEFDDFWEVLFTTDRIRTDSNGNSFVPLRTIVQLEKTDKAQQFILSGWQDFKKEDGLFWYEAENGQENGFRFDEFPFFYIDAQRDILEDIKLKTSYLSKMLDDINYSKQDVENIESQIKVLNDKAISSSDILSEIKETLKELDVAMDNDGEGVELTPFTKKVRDLSKGLSIYYTDQKDSFSMEYHGMGTRSWSSLLILKSYILHLSKKQSPFFPILAIEEPEAHLHPNAQKRLYRQINEISGQKIISTHSPYIAAAADLKQIRNLYKNDKGVSCGKIVQLNTEECRKINRQVINTRGEIFFSKLIVFFEGETEEQALPIFAEHYFKKTCVEMGIDFIGVGGHGNYLPFLRFAESLNIPWFIFSDGEDKVKKDLKKSLKKLYDCEIVLADKTNILILNNGHDFERYLIEDNYTDEIITALTLLHSDTYLDKFIETRDGTSKNREKTEIICNACNQNIYIDILRNYQEDSGLKDALYDCITSQKTQISPFIADEIVKSEKGLPPKIVELFEKIKNFLAKNWEEE